jgi:hypothetical protein
MMTTQMTQAVTGLTPPELGEARIRDVWPSVARMPAIANLGKFLTRTIVLAPLGWVIMAVPFFSKLLPFLAVRYSLTNRRVTINRGWKLVPRQEVLLSEIDDVQLDPASVDNFFRSGNLMIHRMGGSPLMLKAVPDPESFRHAILDAVNAWVPGKVKMLPFISATVTN